MTEGRRDYVWSFGVYFPLSAIYSSVAPGLCFALPGHQLIPVRSARGVGNGLGSCASLGWPPERMPSGVQGRFCSSGGEMLFPLSKGQGPSQHVF